MGYRRQGQNQPTRLSSSRLFYRSMKVSCKNINVLPRVWHCTKRGLHRAADCKNEYPARKRKTYKTLESGLLNTSECDAPAAQRVMSVD